MTYGVKKIYLDLTRDKAEQRREVILTGFSLPEGMTKYKIPDFQAPFPSTTCRIGTKIENMKQAITGLHNERQKVFTLSFYIGRFRFRKKINR